VSWDDSGGEVEFHLPHSELIELLHANGFRIERLLELGAPAGAVSASRGPTRPGPDRGPARRSGVPRCNDPAPAPLRDHRDMRPPHAMSYISRHPN